MAVFYHLILFIGDPFLLGGFKMGDEFFDLLDWKRYVLGMVQIETSYWMTVMNNE